MTPRGDAHGPWGSAPPDESDRRSYAEAEPRPFWLDSPLRPEAAAPLAGEAECDLAIVGGGLSGLWAALLAQERDPGRDIVVLEGDRIAAAASGRNGGFILSSLTHGVANGLNRFADEMPALERLGRASFDAAVAAIERHAIDCDLELNGGLDVAVEPHELDWLAEGVEPLRGLGHEVELLDREAVRAEVDSPIYEGGIWQRSGAGLVDAARLCWGLARAAGELGTRLYERTPVRRVRESGAGVELETDGGRLRARRVLLATSAFRGLVGAIRRRIVPVYDYVLVTEPLSAEQRRAIGWRNRQGLGDLANQFHYYRLTPDDRILWGGYDAVYHYGGAVERAHDQRDASFALLAKHFFITFPQLEGVRFSHRWGGAIDTCTRFFAFYGTAMEGRVSYAVGHTGLGVGASRFGAEVALDLLAGRETEATRLRAVRSQPLPFPPEPLRWAAIELTRNRLAAADRRGGRRGLWLRALDRAGLGFDS
ncbi:MAG: FAD-dependent oxidoreductase [Solirubrobacterales bacterium]|nr:FAD-dependent oxidoreductase [Solirubrobacterales bacterium]